MAAQIIHLQQLHAFGQKRKIFLDLCRVGHIVNDADTELCAGDHTLNLAGIGHGVCTGNCVLGLDLGHTHIGKLFGIRQKGIRKLQAGTTHRFRGTEQAEDLLGVFVATSGFCHCFDIFNSPLSFAVEFGRYTFAGMVYLGSIYVMRDDGHIGLDIVVDALPEPLHTIVKKFSRVLVLAYLAIFFCMSTRMVIENWTNRSSTMHLPMSVVYLAMVIGSAGMFIEELLLLLGKGGSEKLDAGDMGGGM